MKNVILIQARLNSNRFPNKMLEKIENITLVEYVYLRCKQVTNTDKVAIITSINKSDDKLYNLCIRKNIPVFRGDLDNVLQRYIEASEYFKSNVICRVCGDSPFVDVEAINTQFNMFQQNNELQYSTTTNSLNGFMSEVMTLDVLKKIYKQNLDTSHKEHVTKYIRDNISKYNTLELNLNVRPKELCKYTLTVDYPQDIKIIKKIVEFLTGFNFTSKNVLHILRKIKDNNE
jgi:spore coat polysaccharide biosynthesis protein SpsF (cytidylyltransferase family)